MTKQTQQVTRRNVLKQSALIGAWAGMSPLAFAGEKNSPNEKLNIACIGTQNRAGANIGGVSTQNFVAFCDVDENFLNKRAAGHPNAKKYRDFRVMLEKEAKNIDAVVVSTADHTHAPATAMALKMGKHVYCEKPLTHTVEEARIVAELAKKNNLATQMGTQVHASENYRRAVEVVQSGAIGKVTEAHVWCGKGWSNGRFKFGQETPTNLDWDLWLGPAPKRPYSQNVHPANWRRFWDYGTGTLGDMSCHITDLAFWALNLRHPTQVSAEGPPVHEVGTPSWVIVHYDFPAIGDNPALKMHWYDGEKKPALLSEIKKEGGPDLTKWGIGVLFVGDKGKYAVNYGQRVLMPVEDFKDFKAPEQTIPRSVGHHNEWINACKTGSPTSCNFDYSGALTETVLLGTVAYRSGETLQWDAANLKATNSKVAANFISKEYRKGWEVTAD